MSRSGRSKQSVSAVPERKRRGLSREKLIAAGLELIDEKGATALTMRALARAVDVTPMALYNHFSSKGDLLAAVADHVVSAAEFDGKHEDWRDQVRHCFEVLRSLCLRHPGLPGLLEQEAAAPPSVFTPMDVTLRALRAAGLNVVDSARAYFLLVGYTLSQAAYQTRAPIAGLEPSEPANAERVDERGATVAGECDFQPWDFDASFTFGISLILSGVEATVSRSGSAR